MASGTLIAESVRIGAALDAFTFTATRIERVRADLSAEQRSNGLPEAWTLVTEPQPAIAARDYPPTAGLTADPS